MDTKKVPQYANRILEEKRKIQIPEKQNILNDLKALRETTIYTERMMSSENYKPLSKNSIDKLSSFPQAKCFSDAIIYSIAEKLKTLVDKNKNQFTTDFITNDTCGHNIQIFCKIEDNYLEAIEFDVWNNPPKLEVNTYSTKKIEEYIEYFPEGIEKLKAKRDKLINLWQKGLLNLKNTELKQEGLENHIDEDFITDVAKQENTINNMGLEIKKLEQEIEKRTRQQEQAQYLEKVSKSINLSDFEKLIELVERTLGINLDNDTFQKGPNIESDLGLENLETYNLDKNNCKMQYVKKIRTFKK